MLLDWQTSDSLTRAVSLTYSASDTVFRLNRFNSALYRSQKNAARAESDAQATLATELLIKGVNKTRHPLKAPERAINLC